MSTPHPRDRAVEQLLRRRTTAASAESPSCADAETLAAWVEGGLDAQAMAETELHLSNCARCQAMLAAIVRSEPDAPAVEPWWSRMHLRWLVPLTAAAAATVLWMVVPGAGPGQPIAEPETMQARAERSDAAGAPAPSPEESRSAAVGERSPAVATPPPAPPASPAAPVQAGNEARKAAPSADQGRADTSASDQPRPGASAANRAREEGPAERQALAKQQSADNLARSNERQPEPLKEEIAAAGVTPAAEAPRAAGAMPPPPAPAAGAAGAVTGFADGGMKTIPSRDAAVRWRLPMPTPADAGARRSTDGMVERSDDGGVTWQRISTGIARTFTAGIAPSATVCWLVGTGGTVALTTDARTWRQLSPPTPDANLTSVEASDARTATVRDTQGRAYRTTDGGATWLPVP